MQIVPKSAVMFTEYKCFKTFIQNHQFTVWQFKTPTHSHIQDSIYLSVE